MSKDTIIRASIAKSFIEAKKKTIPRSTLYTNVAVHTQGKGLAIDYNDINLVLNQLVDDKILWWWGNNDYTCPLANIDKLRELL